jgi:hypothetical protein
VSDRTAARIFASVFHVLAGYEPPHGERITNEVWGLMRDYDFEPVQMGCDESLAQLGLACIHDVYDLEYGPEE